MAVNRMSRFKVFIGTWNTTGEVLHTEAAPPGILTATDTYRWLPGNHFIAHDADARFDNQPTRSMEVIGYDPEKKEYFARSYDDQGVTEKFQVELKWKHWRIIGGTVRFNGKFNSRNNKLTGLWEMKGRKAGWQPWIKLTLVRA